MAAPVHEWDSAPFELLFHVLCCMHRDVGGTCVVCVQAADGCVGGAMSVNETQAAARLQSLSTSQESIESLSLYLLHHRAAAQQLVKIWDEVFHSPRSAPPHATADRRQLLSSTLSFSAP